MQGEKEERQAAGSPLRAGSSPVLLHSLPEDTEGGQTAGGSREQHMCYLGAHPPRSSETTDPWGYSVPGTPQLWALKHRGSLWQTGLGWERGQG